MLKRDLQALGQRLEPALNQYLTTHKKRCRKHRVMFPEKCWSSQNPKEGGEKDGMVSLFLAVLALVLSIWAFKRTGGLAEMKNRVDALSSLGLTEMKKQGDSLSSLGESFRGKTADILNRVEKKVRGDEKPEEKIKEEEPIKKEEGDR